MKKIFARSLAVLFIFALSIGFGFVASEIWDKTERNGYPVKYSEYINEASDRFGVPKRIIYAVIRTESGFNASAESDAGAIGLMQITPSTFEEISSKLGDSYERGMMYDPKTNITYGTYYLSYLYKYFNDWDLVFAAYNAGMGKVSSWLNDKEYVDENGTLVNIPYEETKKYVSKVKDAAEKYNELYGDDL